jgi:hypothetical protein
MKEELKGKLNAAFERRQQQEIAAAHAEDVQHTKEAEALATFKKSVDDFIEPAMAELGEFLKAKGMHYRITRTEADRSRRQAISIAFSQDGRFTEGDTDPHFSVLLDERKGPVLFHESTVRANRGGHTSSVGECALAELSTDLLQAKIALTVEALLK